MIKNIIFSILCAAVIVSNAGVGGNAVVNDGIDETSADNGGVRAVAAATPKSSDSGSSIFEDRGLSDIGGNEALSVKQADPYCTTDQNGNRDFIVDGAWMKFSTTPITLRTAEMMIFLTIPVTLKMVLVMSCKVSPIFLKM